MNIIGVRQEKRKEIIGVMVNSIKKAEKPDYEKLIMAVCSQYGLSERTAREYLKVAKFQIGNKDNQLTI